jgi:hypothetical protein
LTIPMPLLSLHHTINTILLYQYHNCKSNRI